MLDKQNQGPQCTACGLPMKLSAIEPSTTIGQDLRTFTCPNCERVQRHIIDSAVTEAWLEPKRGDAIAHELIAGLNPPTWALRAMTLTRVKWTESVCCQGCGKMGRVTFSRLDSSEILSRDRHRLEHGMSGFRTEKIEDGFQFRCVDCNKVARRTKPH
jgi:hypothetical protein